MNEAGHLSIDRTGKPMNHMPWVLLLTAGLLEVVWASAMKASAGFTRLWPSVLGVTAALVSFALLSLALRDLPVGTAYSVWVGVGAVGVVLAGMVWFGDDLTPARLVLLAMIIIGVAGLRLLER